MSKPDQLHVLYAILIQLAGSKKEAAKLIEKAKEELTPPKKAPLKKAPLKKVSPTALKKAKVVNVEINKD